jgi:hypothetical protein
VFLLLITKEVTGSDTTTIAAYIFYNLVYAAASFPLENWLINLGSKIFLSSG